MSQYPLPYSPPPQYQYPNYNPHRDLLAPAKRASWLMFALAVVLCFCGVCMGGMSQFNFNDLRPEQRVELEKIEKQLQNTGISLKAIFLVSGVMSFIPGMLMGVLAFFVRRGGMVSLVLALVLCGLMILMIGFIMVSSLAGGGQAVAGMCLWAIPLGLFLLLLTWLIKAMRAVPQMAMMQAQYYQYYQQYQRAQQTYQQTYGYNTPAPQHAPPPGESPAPSRASDEPPPPPGQG